MRFFLRILGRHGMGLLVMLWLGLATCHAADIDELLYQEALAAIAQGEEARALSMLETLVARQPAHAGAWLDIALLLCDLGETKRSQSILDQVENTFDPPPAILELIHLQRARTCGKRSNRMNWTVAGMLGYDSNLNRGATNNRVVLDTPGGPLIATIPEDSQARSDFFAEAWGEGTWRHAGRSVQIALLARDYAKENAFDTQAVTLSGSQAWQLADWESNVQLRWTHSWLGGDSFYDAITAEAGFAAPLWGVGLRPALDISIAQNRFPNARAFDAQKWTVRPGLIKSGADFWWRANLVASVDFAENNRAGGDMRELGAEWLAAWKPTRNVQISTTASVSRFESSDIYFAPLVNARRVATLWQGRVEVAMGLRPGVQWLSNLSVQKSVDTVPFLAHEAVVLQSGLTINF